MKKALFITVQYRTEEGIVKCNKYIKTKNAYRKILFSTTNLHIITKI